MHWIVPGSFVLLALSTLTPGHERAPAKPACSTSAAAWAPGGEKGSEKKSVVETAVGAGHFKTLVKALEAAKLVEALQGSGPFTVFAPSDEAFAKLPAGTLESLLKPENAATLRTVLTYHVVAGDVRADAASRLKNAQALNGQRIPLAADMDGLLAAGARVVTPDLVCSNGVIHVVDEVLMPATKNVVGTATEAGQFTILAKALAAAGLADALAGEGPFTVFAPTDEAFGKLPKGTLESLLKPENKAKLSAILELHVVAGRTYADQLAAGKVRTLGGAELAIELGAGGPKVGGAGVVKADVEATNGLIHVIDRVLTPQM